MSFSLSKVFLTERAFIWGCFTYMLHYEGLLYFSPITISWHVPVCLSTQDASFLNHLHGRSLHGLAATPLIWKHFIIVSFLVIMYFNTPCLGTWIMQSIIKINKSNNNNRFFICIFPPLKFLEQSFFFAIMWCSNTSLSINSIFKCL